MNVGLEHHLHQPGVVAQVNENHSAVIPPGGHPARQTNLRADVGRPQVAAVVRPKAGNGLVGGHERPRWRKCGCRKVNKQNLGEGGGLSRKKGGGVVGYFDRAGLSNPVTLSIRTNFSFTIINTF